ncbi:MAG: DUF58 domain-containing protein [Armatimonadota bacterium]|nr:DUF58 domain-containing protein [Armatimonadota bacterium]
MNYHLNMILTPKAIIIIAGGAVPLALSLANPAFLTAALIYDALVLAAIAADWLRTPTPRQLSVERDCQDELSMGSANPILLRLHNSGESPARVQVHDEPPSVFPCEGNDAGVSVPPRSEVEFTYLLTPTARGDFRFGDLYLRSTGHLGLVVRQFRREASRPVRVYPDILQARKYEIRKRRAGAVEIGGRRTRMIGLGTEFESLRDYQPDDEYRRIDWKASARRARLTSRQYQIDRTQNIVLALDAGRTMCVSLGGMTKLDYAINAALMLGYVASSGDDRVGLIAFAGEIGAYLPPRRGRGHFLNMLRALYNIPLTTGESDYVAAFRFISAKWRKRSLIVLFTDLLDSESSGELIANLSVMSRRHLCLCVVVGDPAVNASALSSPGSPDEVYEQAAAIQALQFRKQAIASLRRAGVEVVDADPSSLAAAVVDTYADIKARLRI